MTSSKEDDPEDKVVALLLQIKNGLASADDDETPEKRVERLEKILTRVADVLTLYGANIFTLAVHQVQIIKQVAELEEILHEKSASKMPMLPHFRRGLRREDVDN